MARATSVKEKGQHETNGQVAHWATRFLKMLCPLGNKIFQDVVKSYCVMCCVFHTILCYFTFAQPLKFTAFMGSKKNTQWMRTDKIWMLIHFIFIHIHNNEAMRVTMTSGNLLSWLIFLSISREHWQWKWDKVDKSLIGYIQHISMA